MKHPIIKFMAVGSINTAFSLAVIYVLLDLVKWPYWPATFTGTIMGAAVNYILNKRFTFQSNKSVRESIGWFVVVFFVAYFAGYQLGLTTAFYVLNLWNVLPIAYHHEAAVLIGSELYTIMNYLGQRYVVFPHESK